MIEGILSNVNDIKVSASAIEGTLEAIRTKLLDVLSQIGGNGDSVLISRSEFESLTAEVESAKNLVLGVQGKAQTVLES